MVSLSTLGAGSPAEEHGALVKEWEKAYRDYHKAFAGAKTDDERTEIGASFPRPIFQDRFMELARSTPKIRPRSTPSSGCS